MENIETNTDIWQVEAGGQVYDTSFDEMKEWIAEGSLLRIDRVRKGNLRWIEAGKVPSLTEFFNAKDASAPIPPVVTTSSTEILGVAPPAAAASASNPTYGHNTQQSGEQFCAVHTDAPASYLCETCANAFCKACPSSYGGSVKICPFCGAMCSSVERVAQVRAETSLRTRAAADGFGFGDFGKALSHPFKFKVSLFAGAVMFAALSLGQSAASMGGIFMMSSALICFMLANMLTFGILGNVADNFSQGKLDENFMPSFDDFSIWDDIVHPFFLSIGVYISSFGPMLAIFLVAMFMVVGAVRNEMNGLQKDAARTVNPGFALAANAADQSKRVRELVNKDANQQLRRVEAIESGDVPDEDLMERSTAADADLYSQDTERMVEAAQAEINDYRKAQLESAFGKAPETRESEQAQMFAQLLGYGVLFILLGGVAMIWGLFYFPAACVVAGYTRSFWATVNPLVGLDTIKRLGLDYVKLLAMAFVLLVFSGIISMFLGGIFAAVDLPRFGNIPANFIGSLFTFYFSVTFSCVIGYLLFKNADRLGLYSR